MAIKNKTNKDALEVLNETLKEAWVSGDLDAFMSGFTDDVIWMPPNQAPVVGNTACADWARTNNPILFGDDDVQVYEEFKYDIEEIMLFANWGFRRTVITMVMVADENGNNPTGRIKGLEVIRKQSDGVWKIARYMWNGYPIG